MALCSYDNELNTKYKYMKDLEMARTAKEVKEAQEQAKMEQDKQTEEFEIKEIEQDKQTEEFVDTDETQLPTEESKHIVDAMTLAERGVKMVRLGWDKELRNHYVTIKRGETKPTFTTGKHGSPYQPSIVDVLTHDWVEMEEA